MTAPAVARLRFRDRASGVTDSASWLGRLMLAPAVLYITLVVAVPFLMAIGYSFSTVTIGTSTPRFVGLENFKAALQDPAFLKALGNTAIFAVGSQTLVIVLASILAIALQRKFRGKWLVRMLIRFLGGADLAGEHRVAVNLRPGLQRHQLDPPPRGRLRAGHLADLARAAKSRDGVDHRGARVADDAAGHRHLAWRPVVHSAGHP